MSSIFLSPSPLFEELDRSIYFDEGFIIITCCVPHRRRFFSSKTINQGCEMSPCQIVIEEHNWFLLSFFFISDLLSQFFVSLIVEVTIWLYMYVCVHANIHDLTRFGISSNSPSLSFFFFVFVSILVLSLNSFLLLFMRMPKCIAIFLVSFSYVYTQLIRKKNPLLFSLVFRLPLSKCCTTRPYQSFKSPDILSSFFSEQGRTWSLKC